MKITERQLRRIIKEAKVRLLKEAVPQSLIENLYNAMQAIVEQDPELGSDVIMDEVSGFMDEIGGRNRPF